MGAFPRPYDEIRSARTVVERLHQGAVGGPEDRGRRHERAIPSTSPARPQSAPRGRRGGSRRRRGGSAPPGLLSALLDDFSPEQLRLRHQEEEAAELAAQLGEQQEAEHSAAALEKTAPALLPLQHEEAAEQPRAQADVAAQLHAWQTMRYLQFSGLVAALGADATVTAGVHARLGLWQPVPPVGAVPLTLQEARAILDLAGPLQDRHHSFAFVHYLRAAHGLTDPRIPPVSVLVGHANWAATVTRTAAVFQAAGITASTPWYANGYVGEQHQLALLHLEGQLFRSGSWPRDPAFPAPAPDLVLTCGEAFMALVGERLGHADRIVAVALAAADDEGSA